MSDIKNSNQIQKFATEEHNETFCLFTEEILNHIRKMCDKSERFIIIPRIEDTKEVLYLICYERYYALVFNEIGSVFGFILRMSPELAECCETRHGIRPVLLSGEWYALNFDYFKNREEIYRILDECYDYTLRKYYTKSEMLHTDAKKEQAYIKNQVEKIL